ASLALVLICGQALLLHRLTTFLVLLLPGRSELAMFFPISGTHISPIYLVIVGFIIGILGGFFGVGGSFIAGPALRLVGVDWNFAVGTDLANIVGKSAVAVRRHRALGNVDLKLGLVMALGTIAGAEAGAQLIQMLKRAGNV